MSATNKQTNNAQQNNQQQSMLPSPLLAREFGSIGTTIFIGLMRAHGRDRYLFNIMEFAYWSYLKKHPEAVQQYNDALDSGDRMVGSNLVVHIADAIKDKIHYEVVRIRNTSEETKEIIERITKHPNFQLRDTTVDILQQNFNCDETDIQGLRDYYQQITAYSGSMLSIGQDDNGETVLIVHIFSID